ncbi:hypothetical protein BS47DRAFT_1485853 [Hydnum rufescens UP504]|uniref:Ran guanine nucleotide release factor n=1 Tax=Hydnum rufescens UP504 TaxID=1448309 RepID=A0A9P6AYJ8_9AGAM|nr:hypothetical protein BS47DRAFT_1485853 [Hydnum rufescens UP504]
MTREYPLFGGAITVELPEGLIDASDLRQVPDTQEVLLTPKSDVTFMIEILQQVDAEDLGEAINHSSILLKFSYLHDDDKPRFHFLSLAHDNVAQSSSIESVTLPAIDAPPSLEHPAHCLLSGIQVVRKFNRTTADTVRIFVALFRIPEKKIDVILSCNVPISTSNPETKVVFGDDMQAITMAFEHAVSSFKIVDRTLFV